MNHPSRVKTACENSRGQASIVCGYGIYQSEYPFPVVKRVLPRGYCTERTKVWPRSLLRLRHPVAESFVSDFG